MTQTILSGLIGGVLLILSVCAFSFYNEWRVAYRKRVKKLKGIREERLIQRYVGEKAITNPLSAYRRELFENAPEHTEKDQAGELGSQAFVI